MGWHDPDDEAPHWRELPAAVVDVWIWIVKFLVIVLALGLVVAGFDALIIWVIS